MMYCTACNMPKHWGHTTPCTCGGTTFRGVFNPLPGVAVPPIGCNPPTVLDEPVQFRVGVPVPTQLDRIERLLETLLARDARPVPPMSVFIAKVPNELRSGLSVPLYSSTSPHQA